MTLETPMRYSALAEQLDEPMIGTVEHGERWLLLEDRSAWGSHAVRDVFGPDQTARAKALRLQVVLVRRREGDPAQDAVRRAMLVDTVTGEMATRTVASADELDVDDLARMRVAAFGDRLDEPLFLVCTNGKRDACCALRGRALMNALQSEGSASVWECTHLGGHRFAANLVCLPDGIVYGRVTASDGPRLASEYAHGRLDPRFLRGRSTWPGPAQVAEQTLRQRLSLDGTRAVSLVEADVTDERAIVTLATADGDAHRLELSASSGEPARPISCRADELERPIHWSVV